MTLAGWRVHAELLGLKCCPNSDHNFRSLSPFSRFPFIWKMFTAWTVLLGESRDFPAGIARSYSISIILMAHPNS